MFLILPFWYFREETDTQAISQSRQLVTGRNWTREPQNMSWEDVQHRCGPSLDTQAISQSEQLLTSRNWKQEPQNISWEWVLHRSGRSLAVRKGGSVSSGPMTDERVVTVVTSFEFVVMSHSYPYICKTISVTCEIVGTWVSDQGDKSLW
jgi:hypothetical protein